MDDYLAKPWELQMLVEAIERAGAVLREHDEASATAAVACDITPAARSPPTSSDRYHNGNQLAVIE